MQKANENLEDLLERFNYDIKKEEMENLGQDTLKELLLKTNRDEWIDILNMMGKGDISQLPFPDIGELCINLSRGNQRFCKDQEIMFLLG